MATQQEKTDYINKMALKRGYVQEYHKIIVQNDYDVTQKFNALVEEVYLKDRLLDKQTKELLLIVVTTVAHGAKSQIQDHIRLALAAGLSPQAILEALELVIPHCGGEPFQRGVLAWQEVVDAPKAEPTIDLKKA